MHALERLARGERTELTTLLHDVELNAVVEGTRVTCHCHSVSVDANGRPRVEHLAELVAAAALEFAIPRSKIAAAFEHWARTGSAVRVTSLHSRARELFTDIANSGEGGELLLFVLAERLLRLPQLICKMSLKTSPRMHVHGADGAHAGVDADTGRLALYWGESKIYGNAADAIRDCLGSLAPMLIDVGTGAANRCDLHLLDTAIDLNDPDIEAAIRRYLDPLDPASNELEMRGLCLVGFDSTAYTPRETRLQQEQVIDAVIAELPSWKRNISNRIDAETLGEFAIHMICVPFPSAEGFRAQMRTSLGLTRAAA